MTDTVLAPTELTLVIPAIPQMVFGHTSGPEPGRPSETGAEPDQDPSA